jgi:threonine/homoserine/homoserine lactone efflux protein
VTPGPDATRQLVLLALAFFAVSTVLDGLWAILAGRLRSLLVRARSCATG